MTRRSKRSGNRIRTRQLAEESFGLPVIAEIPASAPPVAAGPPEVEVVVHPESEQSQAYRRLHVAIRRAAQHDGSTEPGRPSPTKLALLITSPAEELARSYVVVNLAAVFADAGDRVIVATTRGMIANSAAKDASGDGNSGLVDAVTPGAIVAHAQPSWVPGVSSLALGSFFPTVAELTDGFVALVDAARTLVDVLLLEAPLLSTKEGPAMLAAVDLVVVVSESGRTTTDDAAAVHDLLAHHASSPVFGVVVAGRSA